ncbi:MAG: hypothetical protein WAV72_09340 [Bradyrhizobium sp.]
MFALARLPRAGKVEIMVKSFHLGASWGFAGQHREPARFRKVVANRRGLGRYVTASVFGAIVLTTDSALAGPCATAIAQIEAALDDLTLSRNASAAHQSLRAQLHRQPTPSSIARGQEQAVADEQRDRAALERARAADAKNDETACMKALPEREHLRYLSKDRQ